MKGTQTLSDSLDANWMLAGRGDFNADGKPDLVWQHRTDGRVVALVHGRHDEDRCVRLHRTAGGDPQWKIVGVGDFNADGTPTWSGSTRLRRAVGLADERQHRVRDAEPHSGPDDRPGWKAVGVADFNVDGKSDLLWRHIGTGGVGAWLMNGLSRIIYAPLSPLSVPDQRGRSAR